MLFVDPYLAAGCSHTRSAAPRWHSTEQMHVSTQISFCNFAIQPVVPRYRVRGAPNMRNSPKPAVRSLASRGRSPSGSGRAAVPSDGSMASAERPALGPLTNSESCRPDAWQTRLNRLGNTLGSHSGLHLLESCSLTSDVRRRRRPRRC